MPAVADAEGRGAHSQPPREVESAADLPAILKDRGISIAVVATPAAHAQRVVDALVAAGATAVLNFAPTHLDVPDHVTVRTVDLSTELQILSFYGQASAVADAEARTG